MEINWDNTSVDYARFRPDPPLSFFNSLSEHGIGLRSQKILDIGCGTGALARNFARQGAVVCATDLSTEQIKYAGQLAAKNQLSVNFAVAAAEKQPYADNSFDTITANLCWDLFNIPLAIKEVQRLLKPGGLFVESKICWLPKVCPVAYLTEKILYKHNPSWSNFGFTGIIAEKPSWAEGHFDVARFISYEENIPYTLENWLGRVRASKGVGASLSSVQVLSFNKELKEALFNEFGSNFSVWHKIFYYILRPLTRN